MSRPPDAALEHRRRYARWVGEGWQYELIGTLKALSATAIVIA
jgi:hypothetical protein